jgi:hypothetical protein
MKNVSDQGKPGAAVAALTIPLRGTHGKHRPGAGNHGRVAAA